MELRNKLTISISALLKGLLMRPYFIESSTSIRHESAIMDLRRPMKESDTLVKAGPKRTSKES